MGAGWAGGEQPCGDQPPHIGLTGCHMERDLAGDSTALARRWTLLRLLELAVQETDLMRQDCSSSVGKRVYLRSILSCAFPVKWGVLSEAKVTQQTKAHRK